MVHLKSKQVDYVYAKLNNVKPTGKNGYSHSYVLCVECHVKADITMYCVWNVM